VKGHFHGGPWNGQVVELFAALVQLDVESTKPGSFVRYRLDGWVDGEPHYRVEAVGPKGPEHVFPVNLGR
jgi:hypothetical protein